MRAIITKALVALIVILAASTAWFWNSREAEQIRSDELLARINELEQRLHDVEIKSSTSHAEIASPVISELSGTSEADPIAETAPQESSSKDAEDRDLMHRAAQHQREMLRDPAYRRSQSSAERRRFASTRADAIRAVGMTPQQADRVIDLWVDRNFRFLELGQGFTGEQPSAEVQAALKRANDTEQAELLALLGEEKYERWGRYLASGEERGEISQLRAEFAGSKQPLSDTQADALVEVLYSERQRRSREYEDYVSSMGITDRNVVSRQDRQRWLDLEREANQRIHAAAAITLSSPQLASLDEMLASRLAPVEAALRLQR